MSYDYSENILVQESAGELLQNELGWDVKLAYNTEVLGEPGTFGRKSYKEILLVRYFRDAIEKITSPMIMQIQVILKDNIMLKEARDHLLSKLMSGEMEV